MRTLLAFLMVALSSLTLSATQTGDQAGGKKEETLKGKICCAKCELGVETQCMTVIVTKKGDKDVTVYFDKDSHQKNHSSICSDPKPGTVTGIVTDEGKKKVISVKSLKFD